jgi:hypothetical protein
MPKPQYAAFRPADPYLRLVRGALGDLVDGEHFFDMSPMMSSTRFSTRSPVGRALSVDAPI